MKSRLTFTEEKNCALSGTAASGATSTSAGNGIVRPGEAIQESLQRSNVQEAEGGRRVSGDINREEQEERMTNITISVSRKGDGWASGCSGGWDPIRPTVTVSSRWRRQTAHE